MELIKSCDVFLYNVYEFNEYVTAVKLKDNSVYDARTYRVPRQCVYY